MSNDLKSIHDFDFTMICNYFKLLERQGPGSPEVTQKAVSFINELSDEAKIADIGCGTGIFARQLLEIGAKVYGVEINAEMRSKAEVNLAAFNTAHIQYIID